MVPDMEIAVTAPTGNVGSCLVRRLVRAGERAIVLARDPAKLDRDLIAEVRPWQGDLADEAFVTEALTGVDVLYFVLPEVFTEDDPEAHAQALADVVLAAVESVGVGRVVFQSTVGAERRTGAGFLSLMGRVEEQLDALAARTGISVCHLRCGYFFSNLLLDLEGLRSGVLAQAMPADRPLPWVAPDDIAGVGVGRLLSTAWSGRVVQAVHGPADLSFAEVATVVSEVTGWDVTFRRSEDGEVRQQLTAAGLSAAAAESVVAMSAGLREGFVPEQPRSLMSTTSTPLAGWLYDHLRDAR